MSSVRLCALGDLAESEMRDFEIKGQEIIVLWPTGGKPTAFDAKCPHEGVSLAFGEFDGKQIVCGAHQWTFDGSTGFGLFPENCKLKPLPLHVDGDSVLIEI